ncbi:MAG: DegT/DnrJ/EryC1/StrS family aminotransferase [Candidatus Dormibacteraeota bacterium]|jgi:dTDP-4-amino-4,6-dideoxygalactose transaminase|nr:DegT/DnrJ/EryC1/StrS family aminotransferase [Candidatus Dormibacteraeota bacterium]
MTLPIPLVDLKWQHDQVKAELVPELVRIMETGQFILGPAGDAFEKQLAAFVGCQHAIGVSNGTDALELALRCAGLPPGCSVILPAYTFIATMAATIRAGFAPVLVDVAEPHLMLDPAAVERAITPSVKAILAVDLFGQMAPMSELRSLADAYGLVLLEDAAQAHGATHHGCPVARYSVAAATSFYPGKNLGAYGDAGAILTDNPEVAFVAASLRDHGSLGKYRHEYLGFNTRLDEIQAAVLAIKLRHLSSWNRLRETAAARYARLLCEVDGVVLPSAATGNTHTWHLYVVRVSRRDVVADRLRRRGIGVGTHYPAPPHLQPALRFLGHSEGSFSVAEHAASEVLTLPLFPGMTFGQQRRVVNELATAIRE